MMCLVATFLLCSWRQLPVWSDPLWWIDSMKCLCCSPSVQLFCGELQPKMESMLDTTGFGYEPRWKAQLTY
jgi:hypothetical protein